MKRNILLLLMSLVFLLSACSGQTSTDSSSGDGQSTNNEESGELQPEAGAELTLWTRPDPLIEEAIVEFEEKYGIKVSMEDVHYDQTAERLKTDGPAGMGADVINFGHDRLGDAVKAGLVLPNDYFEEETKNLNTEQAIEATSFEGILYGYPQFMFTSALYVNKDLVGDAKLESWDDIFAFAKEFNDVSNNKYGFMMQANSPYYSYAFLQGAGSYIFGSNGTDKDDLGLNNEGAVDGMEFFKTLKEILPVEIADLTSDVNTRLFQEGKVAISLGDSTNAAYANVPFEMTVIPLPKMPNGKEPVTFAGVRGFYVTTYAEYPNAAKLLCNFLTTKEMQIRNADLPGSSRIPIAKDVDENTFQDDELMQGFLKQTKNAKPMPNIPEMSFFWENMGPTFELVWKGADIKETLDKAAENMKIDIEASN